MMICAQGAVRCRGWLLAGRGRGGAARRPVEGAGVRHRGWLRRARPPPRRGARARRAPDPQSARRGCEGHARDRNGEPGANLY